MKLIFLGNIIYDQIYYLKGISEQGSSNSATYFESNIGGIGNYLKYFDKNNNLKLIVDSALGNDEIGFKIQKKISKMYRLNKISISNNHSTSNASIIIDSKKQKTSYVNWQACYYKNYNNIYQNSWCHFVYIDNLINLKFSYLDNLKKKNCILSADMCSSKINKKTKDFLIKKIFKRLDYLFISDNEAFALFQNIDLKKISKKIGSIVNKFVIIHHSRGSYWSDGNSIKKFKTLNKKLADKNINGAGDYFTSSIISSLISNKNVENSILLAHKEAFNYISKFHA